MRWLPHSSVFVAASLVLQLVGCTGSVLDKARNQGGSSAQGGSGSQLPTAGSSGDNSNSQGVAGVPQIGGECMESALPPVRVWRLTATQYRNAVRELLVLESAPEMDLEIEPLVDGYTNNAAALSVTTRFADQLRTSAELLAIRGRERFSELSLCAPEAMADEGCVAEFIHEFGKRAFRRPLSQEEVEAYLQVYRAGVQDDDAESGVRLIVQTMLQSPYLLYRTELGEETAPGAAEVRLTSYELASALAFTLWNAPPDLALLDAAESGALQQEAGLESEARRLLADPKARRAIRQFTTEWLGVRDPNIQSRDSALYPLFEAAKAQLLEEFELLAEEAFFGDNATLGAAFYNPESFLTAPLAAYYGVEGIGSDTEFTRADVSAASRVGLLTSGALLSSWSGQTSTRPMTRGRFLIERVLCQFIPDPPPSLEIPPVREDDSTLTTRERFAQHAEISGCATCHAPLDAVAFALENFDASGVYRATENGKPIDASGTLSGTLDVDGPFQNMQELSQALASSQHAASCLTQQYLRYASGLGRASDDQCVVQALLDASQGTAATPSDLLVNVVKSKHFLVRRLVP
jgi:hypothetical protein